MKNPRVALYLRVSTSEQSNASQLRPLRDYCRRQGWRSLAIYEEKASGFDDARTRHAELMNDCREGRVDVVLVYALDRWGRSMPHIVETIRELIGRKIRFIAVTQNIDTDEASPMGNFFVQVLAAFSQLSGEMIRDRVKAGLKAAKRRGVKLGRPKNEEPNPQLTKAAALRAKGETLDAIAQSTRLSKGYLSKVLRSHTKPQKGKKSVS